MDLHDGKGIKIGWFWGDQWAPPFNEDLQGYDSA